ncbi:leucine-rich repeat flightless-interacting protein 1 isoform X3 [Lemur catta]|uniref:leucine-rich repeat flightless-interacting protein 1 isoform X3 n=1 Tax=Lemur catta TaxID=9447 RepID=UPI001E26BBF4|nr:leucine-rich repeat flightless-interacting protein 1 isoform X3 [Lemur catta]
MTSPAAAQNKEIDCLSPEAQRLAEARLAAKRAARAEAREIRMKELERQQKEIYQVQKKYYGLDSKWGDIEQWMEDSERYSRRSRRTTSASDEDERMSVGSRGSLRSKPDLEYGGPYAWTNGYDGELHEPQSLHRRSSRASVFDESSLGGAPWSRAGGSRAPSECSGHLNSGSRASSRASSARASPVVEERPDKDFAEKGSRNMPGLSAATLASLGGTSSRRGSGDTSISIDTEASIREIKELSELKDQIQDVEGRYMQGLKEMKDSLAEVEEKYKKAMVSNAQLDNEKTNFMYQVDTLKDMLLELEEQLAESRRQYEEKNKEFEREKHAHSTLQFQFAEVKEALKQREEMLEEIRQLQQKQASYIREISDLQETIEWKDKKIGALERQKEFFDSIRSERDDLREEVVMLKEELKKHGIILNSEIATNGETSDTLNNVGYQAPTKITKEELNALKSADGTLGRANEVEVKDEMVENVGKRAILQNTEKEQHTEDTAERCVDVEAHPGGSAEDQQASDGDRVTPLGTVAGADREEQAQSQGPENTPLFASVEQVKSPEGTHVPDDRTGAFLSHRLSDLDGEAPGPRSRQGSCDNAFDIESQSRESVEKQEKGKQEDSKSDSEEVSPEPRQESAPLPTSELEKGGGADPCGQSASRTEYVAQAGDAPGGQQLGTACHDEQRAGAAPEELDPSVGRSLEKEVTSQEAAEPQAAPVQSMDAGGEGSEGESEEAGIGGEQPVEAGVQNVPGSPAAKSHHQEAAGPSLVDTEHDPLDTREPREEKSGHQAGALESSPRKAKNKKKKNKKKKSPVPVETLKDAKKEVTHESTDISEVQEEEQVTFTDGESTVEAQDEVAENPKQSTVAGSGENADCPENPEIELDGALNQEIVKTQAGRVTAGGDTLEFEDDTIQSSGPSVSDKELDEDVIKSNAKTEGATQDSPPEPENEAVSGHSPLGSQSPVEEMNDAPQTGSAGGPTMPEHPGGRGDRALDSISLESDDFPAPAGEAGDLDSESSEDTKRGGEKGRSKEDCTMS